MATIEIKPGDIVKEIPWIKVEGKLSNASSWQIWIIGFVLISGMMAAGYFVWDIVIADKTFISPTAVLVLCVGLGLSIAIYFEVDSTKAWVFPVSQIIASCIYSFPFLLFHLKLWVGGFAAASVIYFLLAVSFWQIKRNNHGKAYIVTFFGLSFILVPTALVFKYGVVQGNWWHSYIIIYTYITGIWLCYTLWWRVHFAKVNKSMPKSESVTTTKKGKSLRRFVAEKNLEKKMRK